MDDRSQAHSESLKVDFDGSKRLLVKFQPVKLSKVAQTYYHVLGS